MATYTGTTQAKPGIGGIVRYAILALAVIAVLTIGIVAFRGGEPATQPSSGNAPHVTTTSTTTDGPWSTVVLKDGTICARCAP